MPVDLSVLIVTHNNGDVIDACLDAVIVPDGLTSEVVVVDNASDDDTVARVAEHGVGALVVDASTNIGFGAGMNLAATRSSGRFLLMLNPDAVLDPSCVSRLVDLATQRPDATLYGGVTYQSSGELDPSSIRRLPSLGSLAFFALGCSVVAPARWNPEFVQLPGAGVITAEMITGSLLLVRREDFERYSGFDERYVMYSEDADLCARVVEDGGTILVDTGASITHDGGGSSKSGGRMIAMMNAGRSTYLRTRWSGPRRRLGLALLWAGSGLRAAVGLVHPGTRRWTKAWTYRRWWWPGYEPGQPVGPAG